MSLTRRELLAATGSLGAGAALAVPGWAREPRRLLREGRFAHVASGLPGPHSTVLWTRVDGLERSGRVAVEIARDSGFRKVVERRVVKLSPADDFTVHARIASRRLKPGTEYFYRFESDADRSSVGRFRTRRPPDSREPVRVGFFSCQAWQSGYYNAHAALAAEPDLDLVVGLGDYIYEASSDTGPREDTIGPDRSAQTLDEYRRKYRLYQSDPNLRAMHAAHPFVAIWDDHEVESSYYRDSGGNLQGRERRVPLLQRRANGYRAFFEHLPILRTRSERDRIYRTIPLGANADVVLTDLHQYADPSPCPDAKTAGPVLLEPCEEAKAPGRSLLGASQREWLKSVFAGSRATWKLWGSSMMLMALDSAPGQPYTLGEWSGWEAERAEIARFLVDRGIGNVAAFSGDIHTFFAGRWTTTGRSDGRTAGVEFVSGSITTHGIAEGIAAASGTPLTPDQAAAIASNVRATNPHIVYDDVVHHGYAVATASADELRVDFRAARSTTEQGAGVFTLARFRVPRGRGEVQVV